MATKTTSTSKSKGKQLNVDARNARDANGVLKASKGSNAAIEPPTPATTSAGAIETRPPLPLQNIHHPHGHTSEPLPIQKSHRPSDNNSPPLPHQKSHRPHATPSNNFAAKPPRKITQTATMLAVAALKASQPNGKTPVNPVGEGVPAASASSEIASAASSEIASAALADPPPSGVVAAPSEVAAEAPTAAVGVPVQNVWSTIVETYRDRPIQFVEDLLLHNYPDFKLEPWQRTFLKAVGRGERRISVRAGHGVGKSAACSWALLWFMFTRYPQKSILTAPTQSQLFDALFSEVKKWCNELPVFMRQQVEVFSDRIELKTSPENSFMSARTSSAERPEALAGVHAEHVLLVVDEASAVPEAVFEAASGSMSGFTATTILISNPTRNTGLFFKTHHQLSSQWFRIHVSCHDSSLVAPDFIQQIRDTYGETSSAYFVRVLGEFAPREDDVLIPAELVDAAMSRDVVLDVKEPLFYGLDVARFGDDRTVLLKRQGNVVLEYKVWSGQDLMQTVGRVMHEAGVDKPAEIMVDAIGLGAGVADRLREQGLNVRDVNVAESSALNPIAAKLRDDVWLTLKDWLGKRMCRLPKSEELRAELVGPTYTFLSNGKIKVESKVDMKKRGMRSPDIADALCLTFAGQAALVGGRASHWVKGKAVTRGIRGIV